MVPGLNLIGGGRGGASCPIKRRHSFDPKTKVLMADGSKRPIEDVNVGDKVAATDPKTGKSEPKQVTQLHRNTDKDLTDLTVRDQDGKTAKVKTTQHHPFWNASERKWSDAKDLKPGTKLLVRGKGAVTVVAVLNKLGVEEMRDLTVADIHTYYAEAGDTPVLVHNCGGSVEGHSETCSCNPANPRSEITLDRDSFEAARNTGLDIVGTLDTGTRSTLRGRLESAVETFGKVTGFTGKSGGEYREFRLDVDPEKCAHINVMTGKGSAVRKYAIRWPSTTVAPWLKVLQR